MKDYKRLTKKSGWHKDIDLTQELGYSYIYQRLSEVENKIEKSTLVELPYKIGDTVFLMFKINDNLYYGDYFVLDKIGFDKLGFYVETEKGIFRKHEIFLNKSEAEKKLKELQGE